MLRCHSPYRVPRLLAKGVVVLTAGGLAFGGSSTPAQVSLKGLNPPAKTNRASEFDPRALELLQRMASAYAHLPALDQKTEFFSTYTRVIPDNPAGAETPPTNGATPPANGATTPPSPLPEDPNENKPKQLDHTLHLAYAQPNRLLLETEDKNAQKQTVVTRSVSDGKFFWTSMPEKKPNGWYTKDKAPGRIRDFVKLQSLNNGCLELLMLMGVDLFGNIKSEVESVRYEGEESVRGEPVAVVAFHSTQPTLNVEMRLYIGKSDFLLRRVATDQTPIPQANTGTQHVKVGDALDDLLDDPPAHGPYVSQSSPPAEGASGGTKPFLVKTSVIYENYITTTPRFAEDTFVFVPPTGALLYRPLGSPVELDPRAKTISDIIKHARTHPPHIVH